MQAGLAETIRAGVFAIGQAIVLSDTQPVQLIVRCNTHSTTVQPATTSADPPSSTPTPLVQPVICWQLPLPTDQRAEDTERLMQSILAQCNAATFGRGNEAVLDPTYRLAYHLPPSRFLTSFHPAQPGSTILADIARMLNPSSSCRTFAPPSIQAELYNLNVYTTGGLFKAHVDTPRADNMFGSLVVCLPVPHQGSQLTVRHSGQARVFDWSFSEEKDGGGEEGSRARQLQWAAFFGNCEHEVAAVTAGYRCTLTYNLYSSRSLTLPSPIRRPPHGLSSHSTVAVCRSWSKSMPYR